MRKGLREKGLLAVRSFHWQDAQKNGIPRDLGFTRDRRSLKPPRPHARAASAIAANESNSRVRQRILLAEIPVYPRHDRQTFSRELDWQMLVCRMLPAARVRMRHP